MNSRNILFHQRIAVRLHCEGGGEIVTINDLLLFNLSNYHVNLFRHDISFEHETSHTH